MTPDQLALARRAVACKAWFPLAGMLSLHDDRGRWFRIVDRSAGATPDHLLAVQVGGPVLRQPAPSVEALLPDLDDAATRGCLLALVREAHGDQEIGVTAMQGYDGDFGWSCYIAPGQDCHGDSEVAALVAALEAAP